MKIFVTSDTHFGHFNICKYCDRPFKSIQEMDNILIKRWNERVKKDDLVYFLGDFCFKRSEEAKDAPNGDVFNYYRKQLNGEIIFVKGNHDKNNGNRTKIHNLVINHAGQNIFMCHNPEHIIGNYQINLHGHIHQKGKYQIIDNKIKINVGVDVWKFYPITLDEIICYSNRRLKEFNEIKS